MNARFALAAATTLVAALTMVPVVRAELVLPRPSPSATVTQTVGLTEFTLKFSRPSVKGRTIWGELVPYDQKWRTGANEMTAFTSSHDAMVGGKNLPAGSYGLFTIPTKGEWTVVFTKQKDIWGLPSKPHDPAQEVLRVTAKPEETNMLYETMFLGFDDITANGANLVLRWEKLRLSVPITVEVNERFLAHARSEIAAAKADDWQTPHRAASWAITNEVALAEAAGWLDKSIAVNANYSNLSTKARWLAKDGKKKDAIAAAKKAIEAGKASKEKVDTSATEKLLTEWMAAK